MSARTWRRVIAVLAGALIAGGTAVGCAADPGPSPTPLTVPVPPGDERFDAERVEELPRSLQDYGAQLGLSDEELIAASAYTCGLVHPDQGTTIPRRFANQPPEPTGSALP